MTRLLIKERNWVILRMFMNAGNIFRSPWSFRMVGLFKECYEFKKHFQNALICQTDCWKVTVVLIVVILQCIYFVPFIIKTTSLKTLQQRHNSSRLGSCFSEKSPNVLFPGCYFCVNQNPCSFCRFG